MVLVRLGYSGISCEGQSHSMHHGLMSARLPYGCPPTWRNVIDTFGGIMASKDGDGQESLRLLGLARTCEDDLVIA